MTEFERLLQAIGVQPADRVTVCFKPPGGTFTATDGTAELAPRRAAALAGHADVWFGVCPIRTDANLGDSGRGTVRDIARIPALWADLDAKPAPAGLGSPDGCSRVVEALSGVLRAQPVAVVGSGTGGLHPYWRLEYAARDHDRAVRLLRRWGVLVRAVAAASGGGADNVFDPTRVLRVPGTTNLKPGGGTVTVTFTDDDAGTEVDVLTLDQVEEALDLAGVRDEPIRDSGDPTPMAEWTTSSTTCSYTRRMADGWATDRPAGGRHQWLLGQAVRLAAARRLGCIATSDVPKAQEALTAAFRRVLSSVGTVRAEAPYELQGALQWGVARVEAMAEDQVRAELGNHRHQGDDPLEGLIDPGADQVHVDPVTGEVLDDADGPTKHYQHGSMGDAHLGERVARYYLRGKFLAHGRFKWLLWDGRRWADAAETEVRRHVRDALLAIHALESAKADDDRNREVAAAGAETDPGKAKSLADAAIRAHGEKMRHLAGLFNVGKIDAVTKVARGFVFCHLTDFDQHPDLLNVGNGVVDLRTGELRPHDPALKLTKITSVDYHPGAAHPAWDKALTCIPTSVRPWLQVRFGQAATGHPPEDDVIPFLRGGGENGKSTVLEGSMKALGEHAVLVPRKAIAGTPGDHPTELMPLRGARAAFLEELPDGDFLDINKVKAITGSVQITARAIGEDNVSWSPTHSLMITTNYPVQIKASDHGTWRRLALVMFPFTFGGPRPTHKGDPTLKPTVRNNPQVHEAALAWIVAGAMAWYANGMVMPSKPERVAADTEAWEQASNDAARFLSLHLELDPDSCVLSSEVYAEFKDWLGTVGKKVMTDQTFWDRAQGHRWLADKMAERANVRTASWIVSRPSGTFAAPPERARVLTGVRWRDNPDDSVGEDAVPPANGETEPRADQPRDPETPCGTGWNGGHGPYGKTPRSSISDPDPRSTPFQAHPEGPPPPSPWAEPPDPPAPKRCRVCGQNLHPVHSVGGFTTCPSCDVSGAA